MRSGLVAKSGTPIPSNFFQTKQVRAVREAGAPQAEVARLAALALPGSAKAGRVWELAWEAQVYVIKVSGLLLCTHHSCHVSGLRQHRCVRA